MQAIIHLALQAAQPVELPPPPGPPPVRIEVDHAYRLACTITPRDGTPFALNVSVKGKGTKRHAQIVSAAPDRFPNGRARSQGAYARGVPNVPARYRESFRLPGVGGDYSINIWWWDGQVTEVGTWQVQGPFKPELYPGRAACAQVAQPPKR